MLSQLLMPMRTSSGKAADSLYCEKQKLIQDSHKGATPGLGSIPVTAGESIDLQWNTWPESHHGPVITYLAAVDGEFADVTKADLQWFKIDAGGLNDGSTAPGDWASDDLIGMFLNHRADEGLLTIIQPTTSPPLSQSQQTSLPATT